MNEVVVHDEPFVAKVQTAKSIDLRLKKLKNMLNKSKNDKSKRCIKWRRERQLLKVKKLLLDAKSRDKLVGDNPKMAIAVVMYDMGLIHDFEDLKKEEKVKRNDEIVRFLDAFSGLTPNK